MFDRALLRWVAVSPMRPMSGVQSSVIEAVLSGVQCSMQTRTAPAVLAARLLVVVLLLPRINECVPGGVLGCSALRGWLTQIDAAR